MLAGPVTPPPAPPTITTPKVAPGTECTQPHTSPSSVVIRISRRASLPRLISTPLIFGISMPPAVAPFIRALSLHPKRGRFAAVPVSHRCPGSTASPEWQQSAPRLMIPPGSSRPPLAVNRQPGCNSDRAVSSGLRDHGPGVGNRRPAQCFACAAHPPASRSEAGDFRVAAELSLKRDGGWQKAGMRSRRHPRAIADALP